MIALARFTSCGKNPDLLINVFSIDAVSVRDGYDQCIITAGKTSWYVRETIEEIQEIIRRTVYEASFNRDVEEKLSET